MHVQPPLVLGREVFIKVVTMWILRWISENILKKKKRDLKGVIHLKIWARKHGRGTRGAAPASDAARCRCLRVGPRLHFFFLGFAPMRLDSCRIGFDSRRTGLIRPKSGRIGHIGSYRPAADTAKTCRKRPKSALNMAGKAETCLLLSFFCESRHSMCFLKIF